MSDPVAEPSADDQRLAELAGALADGLDRALGPWLRRLIADRVPVTSTIDRGPLDQAADDTAREMADTVRTLLGVDIDQQQGSPLAVIRSYLGPLNAALTEAGVVPRPRDDFAERAFPADVHDLSPASFAEIDESLTEPGLMWGAAKAHVHLSRRRAQGQR